MVYEEYELHEFILISVLNTSLNKYMLMVKYKKYTLAIFDVITQSIILKEFFLWSTKVINSCRYKSFSNLKKKWYLWE